MNTNPGTRHCVGFDALWQVLRAATAPVAVLLSTLLVLASPSSAKAGTNQDWETVIAEAGQWQGLKDAHRAGLDLYVWPISITATQKPTIYARSRSPFRLRIYRLGWYGGNGAQLMYDTGRGLAARNSTALCGAQSANVLIAQSERDFGLVECAWTNPVRPAIANLLPGMYLVTASATIDGAPRSNATMFFVRDDASAQRLVIVNPTNYEAYSGWSDTRSDSHPSGFKPLNLYGENPDWPRATKVSFNRPTGPSLMDLIKTDYPLIRFLEREGIPYSIATDYDVDARPSLLDNRRSVVVSGHGEYWSYATRSRLDRFVNRGGNLIAMAANSGYWQIRYERSPANLPGPVIVGYKETATSLNDRSSCRETIIPESAPTCADPYFTDDLANDHLVTTYFRMSPVDKPEQLLFGVQYQLNPPANTFELPITLLTDQIAGMQSLADGFAPEGARTIGVTVGSQLLGNIGWEADVIHPAVLLQMAPTACLRVIGRTQWKVLPPPDGPTWDPDITADKQAHIVLYRRNATSGYVFSGLSMLWSWGLDDWGANNGFGGAAVSRVDASLQALTRNMLVAADNGTFAADCASPLRYSYYFASVASGSSRSLILKESDDPGRWAVVPLRQTPQGISLQPDPLDANGSARLSGWAQASDAYDLFVADVNGDGKADLIAKEKNPPGLWYVALGDGTSFHPEPAPWAAGWAVASSAYDLFVADVDGDSRADLVAKEKNAPGNWYVALSTGTSFQPQPSPWAGGWAVASSAYDLFVTDVNGDSRADLVAKEKNAPGNWYVALSTGTSFQPQPSPWAGGWAVASSAYDLFVVDVNGDGMSDLVAKEKNAPGHWYVALSTGASFRPEPAPWLEHWATLSAEYELSVADVDADGKADLVARDKRRRGNWYVAPSTGQSFAPQVEPLLRK
jgi:FG-GAP-like repeat